MENGRTVRVTDTPRSESEDDSDEDSDSSDLNRGDPRVSSLHRSRLRPAVPQSPSPPSPVERKLKDSMQFAEEYIRRSRQPSTMRAYAQENFSKVKTSKSYHPDDVQYSEYPSAYYDDSDIDIHQRARPLPRSPRRQVADLSSRRHPNKKSSEGADSQHPVDSTISRDNTTGDKTRHASLFALYGQKTQRKTWQDVSSQSTKLLGGRLAQLAVEEPRQRRRQFEDYPSRPIPSLSRAKTFILDESDYDSRSDPYRRSYIPSGSFPLPKEEEIRRSSARPR